VNESVRLDYILPFEPKDIPGLVSFWHFQESGDHFIAEQGDPYDLRSASGRLEVEDDPGAPFGRKALSLSEGQWLSIPRRDCPRLDIHGERGHLTLITWIKRGRKSNRQCEFIAGQWNETNQGRQYGLFLNIGVWMLSDRICGHISNIGGPTPGFKYCMDGSMGMTEIAWDEWAVVAMSYDGQNGYAWLNGRLDLRPGLNPYLMPGGLHDGGPNGSDFTVGAVHRSGEMGNFFCGKIAALAVYQRALTPAEMFALAQK